MGSISSKKNGGSDSEGSLLDSDSDDEGGGSSHLALLEGFFPTLAISLRKHLQVLLFSASFLICLDMYS